MKQFKDFGIKHSEKGLVGDKIKIARILNRDIIVHDYRLKDSRFEGKCLHLQISIKEIKHVVFTGSLILIKMIKQIPESGFPFETTIIEENDHYEFT